MLLLIITTIYFILILTFIFGLFFPNKRTTTKKFKVSVVVAARNEEKNIGNILGDLVNQTYSRDLYEVIIVNDGSEDTTSEIIERYVSQHPFIKHLKAKADNKDGLIAKKNALNQGIQSSSGELILTADADCRVKSTWIETMTSYFTDDVGMVVGFSQLGNPKKQYSVFEQLQAVDFLSLMGAAQGSLNLGCPLAASGQNLAYRRTTFDEVNGYQKIKNRISGDDVLLLQLVHKLTNWKIRFAPSAKSFNWTQPERTVKSFLNQRKRWASNGSVQLRLNVTFFIFLSIMFLANTILFIGSPLYFIIYKSIRVPFFCLAAKFLIEFMIMYKGSKIYLRTDLIKYFPLWAVLQMPYIVFTGILGTLGYFKWKDRSHFQELTTFRTDQ
ncbi:glycosyltransferase [candidate division KSB1 bacterium]|nr:glycosyltransferase [candidate division KSB1 bacterium]